MTFPYWRTVRYTDDGCSLYQCLNCKSRYEGRTAPGWYNDTESVDGPGQGVKHYVSVVNGEKVNRYYRILEDPIYNPVFKFCPFCGVEFVSAIRCDRNNERMLGPRRLRIQEIMYNWRARKPKWYWVFEEKLGLYGAWTHFCYANPEKFNAVEVKKELDLLRDQSPHSEIRVVKWTQFHMEKIAGFLRPREIYK